MTPENEAFARKLNDLMARRGLSQSDLARTVWGSTVDTRGKDVARNRDRISHYVRGSQMPAPRTLKLLADALGVPVHELVPGLGAPPSVGVGAGVSPATELGLTVVAGQDGFAWLTVNKVVPWGLGVRILALIAEGGPAAAGVKKRTH